LTEKQLENQIKKFLRDEECWYLKTWGGGMQRSGIPDILACVNGHFLAIETKSKSGKVSDLQNYNINAIQYSGGVAEVVRPKDLNEIKIIIRRLKYG